jgi:UDP-N-acetylmuramoylalanine--D-glutamate ligase
MNTFATEIAGRAARAVVVGLGKSGYSAARYLLEAGFEVAVTDSRPEPPELPRLLALVAELGRDLTVRCGGFDASLLEGAAMLVVSPGVALTGSFFERARAQGLEVIGDVELFARAARAPIAGITGTNGKSTVTTLVGLMAARAGLRVRSGGNLGPPALDLLDESAQLYVLELSSFQLETTQSLSLAAATVLNLSADHLDRYVDIEAYTAAKARIFAHCEVAIINLDDPRVAAIPYSAKRRLSFSLREDSGADFTLLQDARGLPWLARQGEPLLPLRAVKLTGTHNAANALAALALGEALGVPRVSMLAELRAFTGLAHRMQRVADVRGVRYINDSKGTNVGATLAAVGGLTGPLLVILGGEGKGQDFTPLRSALSGKVRAVLLIGRAAKALADALEGSCEYRYAESLEAAVVAAAALAQPGDTVLLSPACASLDMFRDYIERGNVFAAAVQRLAA